MVFVVYTSVKSQTIYVDILTAPTMIAEGEILKRQQEKTNGNLNKIQQAELLVYTQIQKANNLQEKVVKGLTEVSSLLNDAYTVKDIYGSLELLLKYSRDISRFASNYPQFAVFAVPAVSSFNKRITKLSIEVGNILTSGENNMMNAGQRRELLNDLSIETRLLASEAWSILFSMEQAKNIGFWNAINPFRSWVNQDASIMQDIINRSKYLN